MEDLFNVPITVGISNHNDIQAYMEVIENEDDFMQLGHGDTICSIKTHNTYGCFIDTDGRWMYLVRYPNESVWHQAY